MSSTGSSADGSDEMYLFDNDLLPESGSTDESGSYLDSNSDSGYMEFSSTDDSGSYMISDSDSGYMEFGSTDDSGSYMGSDLDSGYMEFGSTDESGSYMGSDSDSRYMESGSSYESGSYLDSHSGSGYTNCTDISVGGDATYCIEGLVCSGDGSKPTGYNCPQEHDVAIADCLKDMRSFLNGECVAPRDSVCHKMKTGIWGCAWDDEVPSASEEDALATTTPTATDADCTGVRVDGDATYCTTGTICSGSGEEPAGASCPGSGDVAVGDCHDYLPSYSSGKCVAPSNSVCQKLESGTWGCVWSSSKGDNGASYAIDTSDVAKTSAGGGTSAAVVGGIVAALVVAGVIVAVAVAWSRQKRQNQRRRSDISMDAVLTPQSSARNGSFQRV